jgi:hypothetical protein
LGSPGYPKISKLSPLNFFGRRLIVIPREPSAGWGRTPAWFGATLTVPTSNVGSASNSQICGAPSWTPAKVPYGAAPLR